MTAMGSMTGATISAATGMPRLPTASALLPTDEPGHSTVYR